MGVTINTEVMDIIRVIITTATTATAITANLMDCRGFWT